MNTGRRLPRSHRATPDHVVAPHGQEDRRDPVEAAEGQAEFPVLEDEAEVLQQQPAADLARWIARRGRAGLGGVFGIGVQRELALLALPGRREVVPQGVGRVQECAAAARRDELDTLAAGIAAVVMDVARQHRADARALALGLNDAGDVIQALLAGRFLDRLVDMKPARHAGADDDVVVGAHGLRDLREIVGLGRVDVLAQLDIDAPHPPAVGQPAREITAVLGGTPIADRGRPAAAEQRQEQDQPVIPIVIAGNEEQPGMLGARLLRIGKGHGIGIAKPALVLLARGGRIDLVAAHHQDPAARQVIRQQFALREQIGDGVRGIEAVSEVGHEIHPHRSVRVLDLFRNVARLEALVVELASQGCLNQAAIGILPEQGGGNRLPRGIEQERWLEPAHHPGKRTQVFARIPHGVPPQMRIHTHYGSYLCQSRAAP